jgi:hypothetical protein
VELLEVVRRPEQEEGRGARLALDEVGVGLVPAVLDGALVDDLDLGRLAVDQELDLAGRTRELLVVGDVFPERIGILGGEGMAVGPSVAPAQPSGVNSRSSLFV